jgi:hypothetical protein
VISIPEISSTAQVVLPGSSDPVQGSKGKVSESFLDFLATAGATGGKLPHKPVAGQGNNPQQDGKLLVGDVQPQPGNISESNPAKIAVTPPSVAAEQAAAEGDKNPLGPEPVVPRELGALTAEGTKSRSEQVEPTPVLQFEAEVDSGPKVGVTKGDKPSTEPSTGKDKGKAVHAKLAHGVALIALYTTDAKSSEPLVPVQVTGSKTAMVPESPLPLATASVPTDRLPLIVVKGGKEAASIAPVPRAPVGVALSPGKLPGLSVEGQNRVAVPSDRTEDQSSKLDEKVDTEDAGSLSHDAGSLPVLAAAISHSISDTPKETEPFAPAMASPMIHVDPTAKVNVLRSESLRDTTPLQQLRTDDSPSSPLEPVRVLSDRAIEISVPDSQHGAVNVRAELRSDGSISAQLLPQSDAGHLSLVSQSNGLSTFLSEHNLSMSVSVVAPTASGGENLLGGNTSGQSQPDGTQFAQHREERERQNQPSQQGDGKFYGAEAGSRGQVEETWNTAQPSTQYTGRPGWISIRV